MKKMSKGKGFTRKVSITLVTVLLLSLMAPILAFAASSAMFHYDSATGNLSGSVYVQDPNTVSVSVYKEDGTVTELTYDDLHLSSMYDDENNRYYSVSYSVYLGATPQSVDVNDGERIISLDRFSDHEWYGYSTVTLDVYRMEGTNLLPSLQEESYIPAGSDIASFTPVEEGADSIEISLPAHYGNRAKFSNVTLSDFMVEDLTVGEAVYLDSTYSPYYWIDQNEESQIILKTANNLTAGHEYKIKLSESAVNKIQMPAIGTGYYGNSFTMSVTTGYQDENWRGDIFMSSLNTVYFNDIQLTAKPTSSTGGGVTVPVVEDKQTVNEASLKNGKDGKVTVDIANGTKQVLLPANAAKALGKNDLELKSEDFTVSIPTDVLDELSKLVSEDELGDANISFSADQVSDTNELAKKIGKKDGSAAVTSAGDAFDFNLSIVAKDGKEHKLEKFSKPLTLTLKANANADAKLTGVYYIADDDSIDYIGGKIADGKISAKVKHFSTYAVLEYNKSFKDVDASYWASDVIKAMAAKQIIAGVSAAEFAPAKAVTRAEFAAFLVRSLDLEASGEAEFTDVSADKWYAEEVAAAAEAGIVSGRSDHTFAPDAQISREEMAVMIVRAYEYQTGNKTAAAAAEFSDSTEVSTWAQSYVNAAYELGFIKGRGDNAFVPKGVATRAESAQVVSILVD
jgi:hypothetical protein